MGKGLPYDPPSRRTPPNKRRLHPPLTRVVRDRTADGEIEKNPGPIDAQTTENDIPPQHREMVTRLASEIETASDPHYPAKLYKYAAQALTEALQKQRRASTHPPPPTTQLTRTTCRIVFYTWHIGGTITRSISSARGTWPRHTAPNPLDTSELSVKTQKHHSPLGLNMTTAIDATWPTLCTSAAPRASILPYTNRTPQT